MNIFHIVAIVCVHWIADFTCQTGWMAANKSKDNWVLLEHTAIYSTIMLIMAITLTNALIGSFIFFIITFVAHTATDYVTSRITSRQFAKKTYYTPFPNLGAFTTIGADQMLHAIQLFVTWYTIFVI